MKKLPMILLNGDFITRANEVIVVSLPLVEKNFRASFEMDFMFLASTKRGNFLVV